MTEIIAEPNPETKPETKPGLKRWRDILLLVFSLVSILILLGRAIYLAIIGFSSSGNQTTTGQSANFYGSVSMIFCVILLLPVVALSIRRLKGQTMKVARVPPVKLWQVVVLVGIWAVVIIFSSVFINLFSYGWVVAVPFFLLGVTIPIAGLLWIAIGGLPTGSWRRLWATLGIGMTVGPTIAIALELLAAGAVLVLASIAAAINPAVLSTLEQLRNQVTNANNVQDLLPILSPYLNNPWVLLVALIFVAGIGPLIEEAFKPIAVLLVGKRLNSPAEGFALGALSGAGFALLEGMLVTSGATDILGISLAGRATSSLMHITASALMGWAIASAILEKRYGRLALTYLLSASIHGLWNGAVVLTVYGGLRLTIQGSNNLDLLGGLTTAAGIGLLVILLLAILVILPIINRRLRPATPVPMI